MNSTGARAVRPGCSAPSSARVCRPSPIAMALAATAVLALAACTPSTSGGATRTPHAVTPTASAAPTTAQPGATGQKRTAAATTTYQAYWKVLNEAVQKPSGSWGTALAQHASGLELRNAKLYLETLARRGERVEGTVRTTPTVLEDHERSVLLRDCIDISHARYLDRTGKATSESQAALSKARYVSEARVSELSDGEWRVSWTADRRNESC